jgi:hypothetical protein
MLVDFLKEALGRNDIVQPTIKGIKTRFNSNEKNFHAGCRSAGFWTVEAFKLKAL